MSCAFFEGASNATIIAEEIADAIIGMKDAFILGTKALQPIRTIVDDLSSVVKGANKIMDTFHKALEIPQKVFSFLHPITFALDVTIKLPKSVKVTWGKTCGKVLWFRVCIPYPIVKIDYFDFNLEAIANLLEKLKEILYRIPGLGKIYEGVENLVETFLQKLFPFHIRLPLPKLDLGIDRFKEEVHRMGDEFLDKLMQLDADLFSSFTETFFRVDFFGEMMRALRLDELQMPDIFNLVGLLPEGCEDIMCVISEVPPFEYVKGTSFSKIEESAENAIETVSDSVNSMITAIVNLGDGIGECRSYKAISLPFVDAFLGDLGLTNCPQLSTINVCDDFGFNLQPINDIFVSVSAVFRSMLSDIDGNDASRELIISRTADDEKGVPRSLASSAFWDKLASALGSSALAIPVDAAFLKLVPLEVMASFPRKGRDWFGYFTLTRKLSKYSYNSNKSKALAKAGSKEKTSRLRKVFEDPALSFVSIKIRPDFFLELTNFTPFNGGKLVDGSPYFVFGAAVDIFIGTSTGSALFNRIDALKGTIDNVHSWSGCFEGDIDIVKGGAKFNELLIKDRYAAQYLREKELQGTRFADEAERDRIEACRKIADTINNAVFVRWGEWKRTSSSMEDASNEIDWLISKISSNEFNDNSQRKRFEDSISDLTYHLGKLKRDLENHLTSGQKLGIGLLQAKTDTLKSVSFDSVAKKIFFTFLHIFIKAAGQRRLMDQCQWIHGPEFTIFGIFTFYIKFCEEGFEQVFEWGFDITDTEEFVKFLTRFRRSENVRQFKCVWPAYFLPKKEEREWLETQKDFCDGTSYPISRFKLFQQTPFQFTYKVQRRLQIPT
mmetsp:Transcript_5672/g.11969  ORF Transcript_5672/g.11969 Transcript_5672/m.11969 type:complete len:837 (-) Transcript_5672:113-2623(-)